MRNFDSAAPVGVRRVTPQAPGLRALAAVGAFWLFGVLAVLFGLALLDRLVKHHGMLFRTQIIAALFVASAIAAALALCLLWWEHRPQNSRTVEEVVPLGQALLPAPAAPRQLEVFVRDGNRTAIASAVDLDISDDRLLRFGEICYGADGDLSEGRWVPDKTTFPKGVNQFRAFRTRLQDRGFITRASAAQNAPFLLTAKGRTLMRALAQEARSRALARAGGWEVHPPPDDSRGGGLLEAGQGG